MSGVADSTALGSRIQGFVQAVGCHHTVIA
jgi:hypothetical protein